MRFRLGLLQDTAAIERQIARDAEAAKKPPTVKTEAQTKADEARAKEPEKKSKPKIRPLSEAKAIELGANFVSETFLLGVAIVLVLFENYRRGAKEVKRGEDVQDKLDEMTRKYQAVRKGMVALEKEVNDSRGKDSALIVKNHKIIPDELRTVEDLEIESQGQPKGWLPWLASKFRKDDSTIQSDPSSEPRAAKEVENSGKYITTGTENGGLISLSKSILRTHARDINPGTTNQSPGSGPTVAHESASRDASSSGTEARR